jgi:hypothetical protein
MGKGTPKKSPEKCNIVKQHEQGIEKIDSHYIGIIQSVG